MGKTLKIQTTDIQMAEDGMMLTARFPGYLTLTIAVDTQANRYPVTVTLDDDSPVELTRQGSVVINPGGYGGNPVFLTAPVEREEFEVERHTKDSVVKKGLGEYRCPRCKSIYLSRTKADGTECQPRSIVTATSRIFTAADAGPMMDAFNNQLCRHQDTGSPITLYC